MNRNAVTDHRPSEMRMPRLALAAPSAPMHINVRLGTASANPVTADDTAPATNPICTAMVSSDAPAGVRSQTSVSWGRTNDAENQTLIESKVLAAIRVSAVPGVVLRRG